MPRPAANPWSDGTGLTLFPGLNTQQEAVLDYVDEHVIGDGTITKIVKMTAAAYAALGTKDSHTLYVIVG